MYDSERLCPKFLPNRLPETPPSRGRAEVDDDDCDDDGGGRDGGGGGGGGGGDGGVVCGSGFLINVNHKYHQ